MSRKNSLKRRRDQHAAALLDERLRLADQAQRRERRRIKKEKKAADAELSVAFDKLGTVEEGEAKPIVPKLGAPVTTASSDDGGGDKRMRVASRIRKRARCKKAAVRSAKIRARMLARQENLTDNMGDK